MITNKTENTAQNIKSRRGQTQVGRVLSEVALYTAQGIATGVFRFVSKRRSNLLDYPTLPTPHKLTRVAPSLSLSPAPPLLSPSHSNSDLRFLHAFTFNKTFCRLLNARLRPLNLFTPLELGVRCVPPSEWIRRLKPRSFHFPVLDSFQVHLYEYVFGVSYRCVAILTAGIL